jgi:hypothetical protein
MKLSDYVIRFIAQQGVKHVFTIPGGGAMHLVDSIGRNEDISTSFLFTNRLEPLQLKPTGITRAIWGPLW